MHTRTIASHLAEKSAVRTGGFPTVEAEFPRNGIMSNFIPLDTFQA
jgi:hypothetical protein